MHNKTLLSRINAHFSVVNPTTLGTISIVAFIVALLATSISVGANVLWLTLFFVLCMIISGLGVAHSIYMAFVQMHQKQAKRLSALAQQTGMHYEEYVQLESAETGSLPGLTEAKRLRHVITGNINGFPVKIFGHTYTLGKRTMGVAVVAVDLPHRMPHMVIDYLLEYNDVSILPVRFKRSQKIELEGDFSRYFAVYAPDQRELDALILLAPDVMLALLQQKVKGDVEFVDNKLYLYLPYPFVNEPTYAEALRAITGILQELDSKLRRFDRASIAPAAALSVQSAPDPSVRLRRRRYVAGGLLSAGFIALIIINSIATTEKVTSLSLPSYLPSIIIFAVMGGIVLWGRYKDQRKAKLRDKLLERYSKGPHQHNTLSTKAAERGAGKRAE